MTLTGWRKTISKCFIIPQRVVLSIMGFFAIVNAYAMRVCLNVAITEIVVKNGNNSDLENHQYCPADDDDVGGGSGGGEFDWSQQLQGVILGSFFWGYIVTQIPGGILSEKYGGKYTLGLGILSTSIFTLITPVVIHWAGALGIIVLRILEGLGEGTTFPALSALLATWVPLKERSKLGSLVFGGGQIGNILGNAVSGLLIDAYNSWESVFYFFGVLGIVWSVIFFLICYKDPESHPFIKDSEKEYLRKEMGSLERNSDLPPTPWKEMLLSVPMIALIIAQIGHDFGYLTLSSDLPKYMSDVLKYPIKESGLFTALPYICMWVASLIFGFMSDWMITRNIINITNARKLFTTIASVGPAIFLVLASYAGCNRTLVILHFIIAMTTMAGFYPGMKVNCLDLAPNYAANLMAVTNGIGALTGIIGPYIVGVLTPNQSLNEWRIVFWIVFAVFNVTNVVYIIWASGEVQPWNKGKIPKSSVEGSSNINEIYNSQAKEQKLDNLK